MLELERLCYTKWNGALISIIANTCVYPTISHQYGRHEKGLLFMWERKKEEKNLPGGHPGSQAAGL